MTKDIDFMECAYRPNTGSLEEKSTQRIVEILVELIKLNKIITLSIGNLSNYLFE